LHVVVLAFLFRVCLCSAFARKNTINSNAKIASINLKQLNVFNTELEAENNALFRFANRAHIQTEPEVIKSILLNLNGYCVNKTIYMTHKLLLTKIVMEILM